MQSFLGTGWSFPPAFIKGANSVEMVSTLNDIAQSIRIILGTTPGERVMQPEFGCHLKRLVFEKIDANLVNELNDIVGHALLNFEPRVNFLEAEVLEKDDLGGILQVRIHYTVIATNTRHNIVYPFYKLEGTNISI